ncbi:uncharacterized protein LDX57_004886 [Aspergillus melleus]|uniref:uncharacterized protein n=1 Tax=Aspergillus melleus TaxID=138277 RepID=UPI001E8E0723|nr:uncharacterized protein LDX57_004886 [Aspergillus melleus]KAH8427171.1 hypothetical protein LDX57_004886 [Aspergillus melleus]
MEDLEFFDITFIGRPISFPSLNSVWTLTEKLRERHAQMTPDEVLEDEWAVPSVSYGTFRAKNTADLTQEAFVRIILQVYHAGGEIMSSEERARQAKQTLPRYGQDMLDALTLLEEAQCSSAPRLLGVARKVQSSTDPVPGGFYTCLLLESLPGQKIGPWFWQLDLQKRDFIRAQFKAAWL